MKGIIGLQLKAQARRFELQTDGAQGAGEGALNYRSRKKVQTRREILKRLEEKDLEIFKLIAFEMADSL